MKIQDIPKSGKCGNVVAFRSRYGLCLRELVIPRNTQTEARQFMRSVFGRNSRMWSAVLSDEQQDRWNAAAGQVMSHPRLGAYGPLTGPQFFQSINSVRARVDLAPTLEPPAPVVFGLSPVRELTITNDEDGVRLWGRVAAAPDTDIMVFAQEPCSRGRSKRRNVSYIGLLPPPIGDRCEITQLYKARFGTPRANTKIFIVTSQTRNGWKGFDQETHATVPAPPIEKQALSTPVSSQILYMHKGSTPTAQGLLQPPTSQPRERGKPETRVGQATEGPSDASGGGDGAGIPGG